MKGWKTRIPDHTGLRKRRRGQEKICVGSEERTAGLEEKDPGDTTGRAFHKLGGGLEKQDLEGGVQI